MNDATRMLPTGAGLALACASAAWLVACGGNDAPQAAAEEARPAAASSVSAPVAPRRLTIDGIQVLDPEGHPVRLRGVNVQGVNAQDVATIADTFHLNMVRLRISYIPENRSGDDTGFTEAYRQQVDQWVELLRARGIWMVLEMRANDNVTHDPAFYDTSRTAPCSKPTSCADFGAYLKAWRYLASRYRSTDYIAGYGLLAEPSAERTGQPDPHMMLLDFQKTLMREISLIDERTPFFVGPNYNYDTMEYVQDAYYEQLMPTYRNRLVYEVNFLAPKEWIQDGTWTLPSTVPPTYPFPDPADPVEYDTLLQGGAPGDSMEKTFNNRRVENGNYQKTLSKGFIPWYLQWPLRFQRDHQVPLYVDQFGACTDSSGQLAYEGDLVDFFEARGLHWSRWSYNAAGPDSSCRTLLPPNDAAIRFYTELGKRW